MEKEVLLKIAESRKYLHELNLKKDGHNSFSNFDYYTPEQINYLVQLACSKFNIIYEFVLLKSETLGYYGKLTITDLDSFKQQIYENVTAIPTITATNASQQIGGCMTYTERYMLMAIFGIKDNTLDFDSQDNRNEKKSEPKKAANNVDAVKNENEWLTDRQCEIYVKKIQEGKYGTGSEAYNKFIDNLSKAVKINKRHREILNIEFESDFNKQFDGSRKDTK